MEGTMATDAEILSEVTAALTGDGGVKTTAIRVNVVEAIVKLNGHVGTLLEKRAAQRIAAGVPDVRAVIDDLMIEPADRTLTTDEVLAERAYERLAANPSVPLDRIHVTARDGMLTVRGDVDHRYQWQALQTELESLEGVGGIRNEVTTIARPDLRRPAQAAKVKSGLGQAS
ncbi:MAG: BON domain-containing protein, partial [Devosia sp.]